MLRSLLKLFLFCLDLYDVFLYVYETVIFLIIIA